MTFAIENSLIDLLKMEEGTEKMWRDEDEEENERVPEGFNAHEDGEEPAEAMFDGAEEDNDVEVSDQEVDDELNL